MREILLEVANEIENSELGYSGYNFIHPKKGKDVIARLLEKIGATLNLKNNEILISVTLNGQEYKSSQYARLISEYVNIPQEVIAEFFFQSCYINTEKTINELRKMVNI